jgi:hypothetical protein
MSGEETKQRFKLWLLTLALAVVLTWYVINPAPGPIHPRARDDDASNAERRRIRAEAGEISLQPGMRSTLPLTVAHAPDAVDDDLPEWPEYIELD